MAYGNISSHNSSGQQLDDSIFGTRLYNRACSLDGECRTRELRAFVFPIDTLVNSGESSSRTAVEAAMNGGTMKTRVPQDMPAGTNADAYAEIHLEWFVFLSPGDIATIRVPVEFSLIGEMSNVSGINAAAYAYLSIFGSLTADLDTRSIGSWSGQNSLSDTLEVRYANTTQNTEQLTVRFGTTTHAAQSIPLVPEPQSYAMLGAGLLSLLIVHVRRRRSKTLARTGV